MGGLLAASMAASHLEAQLLISAHVGLITDCTAQKITLQQHLRLRDRRWRSYLSNLEDLIDLLVKSGRTRGFGGPAVGAAQDGALAAELLLHMYHSTRSSDLLIMLSELQVRPLSCLLSECV